MKKETLKVIGLNLTFFMCCLKKLAWHRRCWYTQSPGEVLRAVLTIPISRSLMKFPRLIWTLMNAVSGCVQVSLLTLGGFCPFLCGRGPSCVFGSFVVSPRAEQGALALQTTRRAHLAMISP